MGTVEIIAILPEILAQALSSDGLHTSAQQHRNIPMKLQQEIMQCSAEVQLKILERALTIGSIPFVPRVIHTALGEPLDWKSRMTQMVKEFHLIGNPSQE